MTLPADIGQHGFGLHRAGLWPPFSALTVPFTSSVCSVIVASATALEAFREFLEYVLAKHFRKNHQALADAVGIDVRSLRRTLTEGQHTLSLEHCLKLAQALRQSVNASYVLQQADKRAQADLIESLYGRAQLSDAEEALLAAWNAIDGPTQQQILKWAQQAARIATMPKPVVERTPDPKRPRARSIKKR